MARIEVNAPDLPGIVIDVGTTRHYPFGPSLAHVVGYVAPPSEADVADDPMLALPGIRVGRAGLEKYHDLALRGRAGAVQLEVNAVGRVIRELDRQEGMPGEDVGLDHRRRAAAAGDRPAGRRERERRRARRRNGEVLAMATNPSFDPTLFNSGVSQAQWVRMDHQPPRAADQQGDRGPVRARLDLQDGGGAGGAGGEDASAPTDRINCPGYLDLGDTRFHCWRKGGHGLLDLRGGLKNSCDVFFYETARRTGIDRIAAMANRFGLGVDARHRPAGRAHRLDPDARMAHRAGQAVEHRRHRSCSGIGQGFLQVTPLQLATYGGAHRHRPRGAAASDARRRRRGAAGRRAGRLAGARPAGTRAARGARGHVGGGERAGRHRAAREACRCPTCRWPARPARRRCAASRASSASTASSPRTCPGSSGRTRCSSPSRRIDAPRYALAVVVEHGNAGAADGRARSRATS